MTRIMRELRGVGECIDEKECLVEVAEEENNCIGKDHEKIED